MKKKRSVLKMAVIGLIVVALATVAVLYFTGVIGGEAAASTTTYHISGLQTGDLTQSVTGTGALAAAGTDKVTYPAYATVAEVKAAKGDSVKAGDIVATLDVDSLQTQLDAQSGELDTLDNSIQTSLASISKTTTVKSPVSGRVKRLFAESGEQVGAVINENGCLLVLSADGMMCVTTALEGQLAVNDTLKAYIGDSWYNAVVADCKDGVYTVTFNDNGPAYGDEVTLKDWDNNVLGTGVADIHAPVEVSAENGYVYSVSVYENSAVSSGGTLLTLTKVRAGADYEKLLAQKTALLNQIEAVKALLTDPVVKAEQAGVVESLSEGTGGQSGDDAVLLTLYTGGATSLSVNVDELDMPSVEVGMAVKVSLDAYTGETFTGEVTAISAIGTASNGVTTYPVTVRLDADDRLLIGMNATATIVIESHENALMVPLAAVVSEQGKQYVYLYTGKLPTKEGEQPGEKVEITTGLSDASYAEVLSGLQYGDQVVITRTVSNTASNSTSNIGEARERSFGGGMGNFSGGSGPVMMPGGGGGR